MHHRDEHLLPERKMRRHGIRHSAEDGRGGRFGGKGKGEKAAHRQAVPERHRHCRDRPCGRVCRRGRALVPPCRRTKQTREPLLSPGKDRPARSFPVFGTGNSSERMRNFELLGVGSCPTGFSRRPISLNMIKNNE